MGVYSGRHWESGAFTYAQNTGGNHGPVRAEGHLFLYADGTAYIPVGTTCYAWVHQSAELVEETLHSLEASPFNKIRMRYGLPQAYPVFQGSLFPATAEPPPATVGAGRVKPRTAG
jgi:hypothetical protein